MPNMNLITEKQIFNSASIPIKYNILKDTKAMQKQTRIRQLIKLLLEMDAMELLQAQEVARLFVKVL